MHNIAKKHNFSEDKGLIYGLIKGSIVALLISMVGILLFALFIKFIVVSDSVIGWVNQIIKALSILFGVRTTLRACPGKGLVKGTLLGLLYTLLAYLVFSFLSVSISFDVTTIIDLVFGGVMGAICGIIMNNSNK